MLKLYDRDRNKKKLLKKSSFKVYISKLLPMLFVSTIQSTVLMLSLGCIGFFLIGPTFLLQYALILYAG
jgi:hypothetical protein